MRLAFILLFSLGLISGGIHLSRQQGVPAGFQLSISHKSLQRLHFDELSLRRDPHHGHKEVSAQLSFQGVTTPVLLSALLSSGWQKLTAIQIEIDEKEMREWQSLVLVRLESAEARLLSTPPTPAPLMSGELIINGKSAGRYALYEHPFHVALKQGLGPLVTGWRGDVVLSASSQDFPLLQKIARQEAASLPDLRPQEWALWSPKAQAWQRWGFWPKEWPL